MQDISKHFGQLAKDELEAQLSSEAALQRKIDEIEEHAKRAADEAKASEPEPEPDPLAAKLNRAQRRALQFGK